MTPETEGKIKLKEVIALVSFLDRLVREPEHPVKKTILAARESKKNFVFITSSYRSSKSEMLLDLHQLLFENFYFLYSMGTKVAITIMPMWSSDPLFSQGRESYRS